MLGDNAIWIGTGAGADSDDAPLLRRAFTVHGDNRVARATLEITGLGYYEAWINGQRVGDHVLDPAQTDYEQRVLYVSYDVTALVQSDANTIGVMLGNGWYNQRLLWLEQCESTYGAPCLLAELHIEFADGSTEVVGTDEAWTCASGPITGNNVYAGENYDARLEQAGWSSPDFDDSGWNSADPVSAPLGRLEKQEMPPIRCIETLRPITIDKVSGRYVVDFGQNFAGWARIQITAAAGTEIWLRYAEALWTDGNIDTASTGVFVAGVEQIDTYTCNGDGPESWEPRFTYHGFRYVEVTGWPGELTENDITGVVVHTDLAIAGNFHCSDGRLNQLHTMTLWTHRSNIHGLPEDCPAREKCGWLGDANVVAEFSMWNFQGKTFWEKYIDDIETIRAGNDGLPMNIAPGPRNYGPISDWTSAFITLPWYVYVFYGDRTVLEKHWEGMQFLLEHFGASANNWILEDGHGDWYDTGGPGPCTHTPPAFTTTIWFYQCAEIMARTAALLGKPADAERYATWPNKIRDAVIERYYDRDAGSFGSQTADVMALQFGLVPDGETDRVAESLIRDIRQRDTHVTTGMMGVRFIFEVLTNHGHGELALALMHQDSYPSFGHLIERGATTLWECWGEEEHDKQDGPRSLNHPMFGGFDNWFFNTLAGIQPDIAQPGFKHFFLNPHPIPGLDSAQAHHDSPHGRIVSEWTHADGNFAWTVEVPEGTTATATLPFTGEVRTLQPGRHQM